MSECRAGLRRLIVVVPVVLVAVAVTMIVVTALLLVVPALALVHDDLTETRTAVEPAGVVPVAVGVHGHLAVAVLLPPAVGVAVGNVQALHHDDPPDRLGVDHRRGRGTDRDPRRDGPAVH